MEKRYLLGGKRLWTRDVGRSKREDVEELLEESLPGTVITIDLKRVEVFDFSFAAEFFGRLIQRLPSDYPGRFIVVENLGPWTRPNLEASLNGLGLTIVERHEGRLRLLGDVAQTDKDTFDALDAVGTATAPDLADTLGVNLTAMNERLGKLLRAGVIRRDEAPGRTRFRYSAPN